MERVNRILECPAYREHLEKNNIAEENRRFCRHNMGHFLDVARIAWIETLEEGLSIEKELIYAAALLHDIGRHVQYEDGTPHEEASFRIAPDILKECGFDREESEEILYAALSHRDSRIKQEKSLRGLIYRADKQSRACFACEAERECNWKNDKKNKKLVV